MDFTPLLLVTPGYGFEKDRSYLTELHAWLCDPSTHDVSAIAYVAELAALKECGFLEPRRSTRLLVRPPTGLSRRDAEELCGMLHPGLAVRQLKPGIDQAVAHLKVMLVNTDDGRFVFAGSSNFTMRGLGRNLEVNALLDAEAGGFGLLAGVLDELWSDRCSEPLRPESFATEITSLGTRGATNLLDFQRDVLAELSEHYRARRRGGALLSLPTGTGKTVIAARFLLDEVLTKPDARLLWVTPQEELCVQASATFLEQRPFFRLPQLRVEPPDRIRSRRDRSELESDYNVIFRVLHTAAKRAADHRFDVVVVDEAHWGASNSRHLLPRLHDHLDAKFWLGLTATPFRRERGDLDFLDGTFPKKITPPIDVDEATDAAGRRVRARVVPTRVQTGFRIELNIAALAAYELDLQKLRSFNDEERNDRIARTWKDHEFGQTLVFAVDIDHANALCRAFNERHPTCRVQVLHTGDVAAHELKMPVLPVDGSFTDDDRRQIYDMYRRGAIDVLIGVNLYTMGVDFPQVQSLFMARPTLSPVLYAQMLGRGRRGPAFGGTETVRVVDFADQVETHTQLRARLMNVDAEREYDERRRLQERRWREVERACRQQDVARSLRYSEVGPAVYRVTTPGGELRKPLRAVNDLGAAIARALEGTTSKVRPNHTVEYFTPNARYDLETIEVLIRDFSPDAQFLTG